jgi:hypothetical protein
MCSKQESMALYVVHPISSVINGPLCPYYINKIHPPSGVMHVFVSTYYV